MARAYMALLAGGALAIVPLAMGSTPLFKLLLFALAALIGATLPVFRHLAIVGFCGTGLHGAQADTVWICRGKPACRQAGECGLVPHPVALREDRMVWGFLLTFFAVAFLSPLWSAVPILSIVGVEPRFEGVMAYAVFLGLAIGAWGMVRAGREQSLLQAVLWSNVGVVLYGLLQVAGKDPFSGWWNAEAFLGRVFSTVGQPNMLGQFLVLTAPLAALAAWRRWGTHSLSQVVLVLNLIVLLATGSRAGMIGAVVGGCIGIGVILSLSKDVSRDHGASCFDGLSMTRRHLFMMTLPFLFFLILVLPVAFHRYATPGEVTRSVHARLIIWRDAASMIRAREMGWGLETTGLLFPRFQRAPLTAYESLTTSVDRAHSKPLDLLLTVGPLGLLSYYAFLLLLLLRCFRIWKSRRDLLMLAGMAGLAGVSVSLLFGFEGVVTHAFFWLVCGMLAGLPLPAIRPRAHGRGAGEGRGEGLPIPRTAAYVFCIILLSVVAFLALSLSARLTMERAERAFQRGDVAAAVQGYDRAVRRAPWDRALLIRFIETALFTREEIGQRIPSPLGGGLGRGGQITSQKEVIDAALTQHFQNLHRLTSHEDPLLPSLEAWHAALQGKREEALGFLEEANIRAHFSIPRLRMAGKVAELFGDTSMREAIRIELTRMLPSWWNDARDPRNRILWKENPWLEEFLTPSPRHSAPSSWPRGGRGSG